MNDSSNNLETRFVSGADADLGEILLAQHEACSGSGLMLTQMGSCWPSVKQAL